MLLDKDSIAASIVSKLNGGGKATPESPSEAEKPEGPDEQTAGFHAACEDMLHAFKSQSPDALFTALKSFMDQYQALSPADEGGDS